MLEALLKRVDGLERRLKDEKKTHSSSTEVGSVDAEGLIGDLKAQPQLDKTEITDDSAIYTPSPTRLLISFFEEVIVLTISSAPSPAVHPDVLLDTYFSRCHGKAYHILDETITRQRIQLKKIPSHVLYAIYAVSARWVNSDWREDEADSRRYTAHPNGYHAAIRLSEDYAVRARTELDIDEPDFDTLQSLLLLIVANTASGKGKKAYMMLSTTRCSNLPSNC